MNVLEKSGVLSACGQSRTWNAQSSGGCMAERRVTASRELEWWNFAKCRDTKTGQCRFWRLLCFNETVLSIIPLRALIF